MGMLRWDQEIELERYRGDKWRYAKPPALNNVGGLKLYSSSAVFELGRKCLARYSARLSPIVSRHWDPCFTSSTNGSIIGFVVPSYLRYLRH